MITSTTNPIVKYAKQLVKKASERKKEGFFVAEGYRLVGDLIKSNCSPYKLLVTDKFLKEKADFKLAGFDVIIVSDNVLESISDTKTPPGIMGIFPIPSYSIDEIFKQKSSLILILEDLRDPGNMGTIFRTFEAAGGDGIILFKDCTDPFSPKCIRSTMGSVVRVPFISCKTEAELKAIIDNKTINIYAADMEGEDYTTLDYSQPTAFIIGNEANGLSEYAINTADKRVSIPMVGHVESLNAAITCAILSFEAKKYRNQ